MFDFEKVTIKENRITDKKIEEDLNLKYESGYSRVITENGTIKVSMLADLFNGKEYNLHPEYQRRITWDNKKRSKLIESLIINIPIPPIFLYEYEFGKYEIMDGLQRVSALIDFYNNEFALTGLEEWKELEGKRYSKLPEKIKEGIGRRQISTITLLKESASTYERADRIKRLLFERLNTGGVKLQPQEIRNAIYNGKGNTLCMDLSEMKEFKQMWEIPYAKDVSDEIEDSMEIEISQVDDPKYKKKLEKHVLYKRMYDVELVLRYFSMRHIDQFDYQLSLFMDDNLKVLNGYSDEQIEILKNHFIRKMKQCFALFGDNAFKIYSDNDWSSPARTVYDPMLIALEDFESEANYDQAANVEKLKEMYRKYITEDENAFDGKKQSKDDILRRAEIIKELLGTL